MELRRLGDARRDSHCGRRACGSAEGAVEVSAAEGDEKCAARVEAIDRASLHERVRLLLRACYRQAKSEGLTAPPRKIVRWREERV